MPSADFWSHESGTPGRPAFQAKLYSRVRFQISPDMGRDLRNVSLPKLHIYLYPLFRIGFVVSSPLTRSIGLLSSFCTESSASSARTWQVCRENVAVHDGLGIAFAKLPNVWSA